MINFNVLFHFYSLIFSCRYIFKYLFNRLNFIIYGKYNIRYYPKSLKNYIITNSDKFFLKQINLKPLHLIFNLSNSKTRNIVNNFNITLSNVKNYWNEKSFLEIELNNATHRFHWLLIEIYNNKKSKDIFQIGFSIIKKWDKKFPVNKNHISWQAYNVSERICNLITFFCIFDKKFNLNNNQLKFVENFLDKHARYLINHLEIPYTKIVNNHILNNFRALYILSQVSANCYLSDLSKVIFKHYFKKIISSNGFLNEGSVHYQFIVTKWFLEIATVSDIYNDIKFSVLIKEKCDKLLKSCECFSYSSTNKNIKFPLIGDVSPDCPVNWFQPFIKNVGWNKLWKFENNSIKSKYKNLQQDGWFKNTFGKFTCFGFLHPNQRYYPYGHGHDDYSSICLFYDEIPILIDTGTETYDLNLTKKCEENKAKHSIFKINDNNLVFSGLGINAFKSSYCLDKLTNKISKDKIEFKGLTLDNIKWSRTLFYSKYNKLTFIDKCLPVNTIKGQFIINNKISFQSRHKNQFIFKAKNLEIYFIFSSKAKVKLKKIPIFKSYGIKKNTFSLNYYSNEATVKTQIKINNLL